ncbi:MAG: TIGR02206 family membrane protein [Chloroflexota bacterium]
MDQFFAKDWTGEAFIWFGAAHNIALIVIIVLNVLLIWRLKNAPEKNKRSAAVVMAAILWANELGWHLWNAFTGQWTIQTMLPLHACSLLVWTGALMLVTKNYYIYEFSYFLGIGGAMQALLTPDLGIYGFPHFRFFQTYISHGLIITAAIYMTVVYGLRPTWKSILRVGATLLVYLAIVFFVNQWIGSNYLFIAHKPPTGSLLDILPEWPIYILYMILIGLVVFLLLYLPFAIKDWLRGRVNHPGD